MAPPKFPPLTAEAANNEKNTLISDYLKQACYGIPKKRANTNTDKITVLNTKGQYSTSNISRAEKWQEKQVKHKSTGLSPPNFVMIKEKRRNYYVGENSTEPETTVI